MGRLAADRFRISGFGFPSDLGFRISDFSPAATPCLRFASIAATYSLQAVAENQPG